MVHLGGRQGGRSGDSEGRLAGGGYEKGSNRELPRDSEFASSSPFQLHPAHVHEKLCAVPQGGTGKERRDDCRKLQGRLNAEDFGKN